MKSSSTIQNVLSVIAIFCTTYTMVAIISESSGAQHIGIIFLIFISSCFAFQSKNVPIIIVSVLYLFFIYITPLIVRMYYEDLVLKYDLFWPYEKDIQSVNNLAFQVSEIAFVVLVGIALILIIYVLSSQEKNHN